MTQFSAAVAAAPPPESYRSPAGSAGSAAALNRAIERIEAQQEELAVAEEELQVQLEALNHESQRADDENARYRMVFDFCPDALFVTDLQGIIREANVAAGALIEIEPRFLHGKPLPIFVAGVGATELRDVLLELERAAASGVDDRPIELEIIMRSRRGRETPATVRGTRGPDPRRIFWSARAPLATMRSSVPPPMSEGEFHRMVSERTTELEDSLERVSTLLDEERTRSDSLSRANDAKDHSLAVVSHELRAPMQAILGWTSLLREGVPPQTRDRALRVIERNARAQADLIENLFEHSRLVTNKSIALKPVDLAHLVEQAVESMRPHALAEGVDIVCHVPAEAWLDGDAFGLDRAVTNLLGNAVRHSRRGGRVFIDVETSSTTVVLAVRDEGDGIEPHMLARVFERFEQGERTAHGGLGLGLFLVKALVQRLRGTVHAFSDGVGTGASFVVKLPVSAR